MGSTNVPNFSLIGWEKDELLGVKISDIPYQLWTASLSLTWLSPIGMKLVPDKRSGPRTHWGQVPKNSYRPIFELWPLKIDICQCLTPNNFLTRGPNFQAICVLCTMELGQCQVSVSARSVKVTFCVFWSLCSAGETYRLTSSPYIFACSACSAIQFGTEMNLPKTCKPYKKRACLLQIDGVIRVFTFSRPIFHRAQCKLEDPFSAGCLAPIPMTAFIFVDINDLRMRINLQHPGCFILAAIGVKMYFYWMFDAQ